MAFQDWAMVVQSKIQGVWNFHRALTNQCLDFFIMLPSVADIVGNRGQAAYAAANTFLDALAAHRRRRGLAAVSLDLAAIDGVGYLAENAQRQSEVLKNLSGSTMSEAELLALVDAAIEGKVDSVCNGQCRPKGTAILRIRRQVLSHSGRRAGKGIARYEVLGFV